MANWCTNALTVRGTKEAVEKFMKEVATGDCCLDFKKLVPVETDISPEDRAEIWWGCSWNAECATVSVRTDGQTGEYCADYEFITNWNAPYLVYPVMSSNYPDLVITARSVESGCDYYFEGTNVSGHWSSETASFQNRVNTRKAMVDAWLGELYIDPKMIDWKGLLKDDRVYYSLETLTSEGPQTLNVCLCDDTEYSVDQIVADHRLDKKQ